MHWYFAIDEGGGLGYTGECAKLAVLSARNAGGLVPHLLYYGKPTAFTAWMRGHGVRVIETEPSFIGAIRDAEAAGKYKAHSIGHWLRVAVPLVETAQEFVLYTDCDVIFLQGYDWQRLRPRIFAAAPEFQRDNWNYFNAGVMLLNVPAMRQTYDEFAAHIVGRIGSGQFFSYDDEIALNEAYRFHWEKLDLALNWKPYWGFNRGAAILHFHGPKLNAIEAITGGGWERNNPTAVTLGNMLDAHVDAYTAWCGLLGDMLQTVDFPHALRFAAAASALSRYRAKLAPVEDMGFMNVRMFNDGRASTLNAA